MSTSEIPTSLIDLLDRPLYGALGTVGRDESAQVSPMWFQHDPFHTHHEARDVPQPAAQRAMSFMVFAPEDPQRYIEVRGQFLEAAPDPTGASTSSSVVATAIPRLPLRWMPPIV